MDTMVTLLELRGVKLSATDNRHGAVVYSAEIPLLGENRRRVVISGTHAKYKWIIMSLYKAVVTKYQP